MIIPINVPNDTILIDVDVTYWTEGNRMKTDHFRVGREELDEYRRGEDDDGD